VGGEEAGVRPKVRPGRDGDRGQGGPRAAGPGRRSPRHRRTGSGAVSIHRELDERLAAARLGGSEAARAKLKSAGRLLVRERLALLLDGDPDFEDGLLARTEEGLAGDAVVTAIGQVDGRPVAV